jgi:putative peptidoglycan lipid II flippase
MTDPVRTDAVATVAPVPPPPAGGEPPVDAAVPAAPGLARAALGISAWNALSRLTGFVRVLAVGGALGATYLGNTYHSANLVSTITFELLAAGLLAAPLVPAFVRLLDRGRADEAERLAGALLGVTLAGLGVLALAMALAGSTLMRLLTAGVDDPAIRAREVRLGAFFLWFFLPQMLLYAAGAVATALLNARRRFAAAAFAPVANNVLVTLTMLTFLAVTAPDERGLGLGTGPATLLALGTTAGVLAMAAVPAVALARAGVRLRPRLDLRHPGLGGWRGRERGACCSWPPCRCSSPSPSCWPTASRAASSPTRSPSPSSCCLSPWSPTRCSPLSTPASRQPPPPGGGTTSEALSGTGSGGC